MSRHHPDLIMCRKQAGNAIGKLCSKCEGRCVICDSLVNQFTPVNICDECNYGSYENRCIICSGKGISEAYYCKECVKLEKDRSVTQHMIKHSLSTRYIFHLTYHSRSICYYVAHNMLLIVRSTFSEGCPKIINLGTQATDMFYERKSVMSHCKLHHNWP